LFTHQFVGPAN